MVLVPRSGIGHLGWRDMVIEPAVLIVVEDHQRALPFVRIGGNGLVGSAQEVFAPSYRQWRGGVVGMPAAEMRGVLVDRFDDRKLMGTRQWVVLDIGV